MAVNELAAALAKAQLKIKSAEKDSANPHFKSGYASLQSVWEACRDALAENNLSVTQSIERDEKGIFLKTTLLHQSGQAIESSCPLLLAKQDMQALGSAITYARRYALAAIVGVTQRDDDAQEATNRESSSSPRPSFKPTPIRGAPARANESGSFRFTFGKFKGKAFSEIDPQDLEDYVQWMKKEDAKKPTFEREKNQPLYEAYHSFKTAVHAEIFKNPFESLEEQPPGFLDIDL